MSESKTERMRIRLTDDIARQIRATAELDDRKYEDQARWLLKRGLECRQHHSGNGLLAESRSTSGHAAPPVEIPKSIPDQLALPVTSQPNPSQAKSARRSA
jgi:hypothetical protein